MASKVIIPTSPIRLLAFATLSRAWGGCATQANKLGLEPIISEFLSFHFDFCSMSAFPRVDLSNVFYVFGRSLYNLIQFEALHFSSQIKEGSILFPLSISPSWTLSSKIFGSSLTAHYADGHPPLWQLGILPKERQAYLLHMWAGHFQMPLVFHWIHDFNSQLCLGWILKA